MGATVHLGLSQQNQRPSLKSPTQWCHLVEETFHLCLITLRRGEDHSHRSNLECDKLRPQLGPFALESFSALDKFLGPCILPFA